MAGTEFAAVRPSNTRMTVIPMPQARTRSVSEPVADIPGPPLPDGPGTKKKKDKVRAAWISFAGRIVAQIVGAAATVTLTLAVVQRMHPSPERTIEAMPVSTAEAVRPAASVLPANPQPDSAQAMEAAGVQTVPSPVIVAVLPLENFSVDSAERPLADALTESLIAELAQIDGARVISRTSSMQYREARLPLPEIARQLGATHVLEGSVVRDGSRFRITAQLIEASSDRHVWARAYDRSAGDGLRVQADVARLVARDLAGLVKAGGPAGPVAPGSGPLTTGGR